MSVADAETDSEAVSLSGQETPKAGPGRPEVWIYRPASWFERLRPEAMFGRGGELEVELGSGDGSFLVAWAAAHPDRRFVGVERLLGRMRKLDRKAQRAGLTNIRGLRIEAGYCLEYLLPPGSVSALHVYFPDPWPKRRHRKNRLVNERFPALAAAVLQPGGWVHLRTDDLDYFQQMQAVFSGAEGFEPGLPPEELVAVKTDFEREFNARGIATNVASFKRR